MCAHVGGGGAYVCDVPFGAHCSLLLMLGIAAGNELI